MKNFGVVFAGLLRTLRSVGMKVLLICVFGLCQVCLSLAFVWASKLVIDVATGNDPSHTMREATIIMLSIMAVQVLIRVVSNYWSGYVTITTTNKTRAAAFEKVMRSTWTGKDKLHSGDTVSRLEEDLRVVVSFICSNLPDFFVTVFQLVAASVFLFKLAPKLAWILIFIMPVAVVGSRLFFRKMRKLSIEIRGGDAKVQSHLQENIIQRILVKTLGATRKVQDDLESFQNEVQAKTITRLNYGAISRLFMNVGFATGYALAFFWGAFGIYHGTVSYGLMVAFLQLVGQIQRPVADITRHIPTFISALSSEERLMEIEEQPQEEEGKPIHLQGTPGIRLEGLSFRYDEDSPYIFENLDYDFKPGTMTAILGSTGAGKSTLVRIIPNLLSQTSGKVILYDNTRSEESCPDTRCNFMYVPQGNSLMSGTIRFNLQLAKPDATEDEMKEALHLAAADFVLDLPAGLDTSCSEVGRGLSEGQAQRIAIARALLRPGGILILDEATSALDADTEEELLTRLSEHYRGKKTILCITHRPAATGYADGKLIINK